MFVFISRYHYSDTKMTNTVRALTYVHYLRACKYVEICMFTHSVKHEAIVTYNLYNDTIENKNKHP